MYREVGEQISGFSKLFHISNNRDCSSTAAVNVCSVSEFKAVAKLFQELNMEAERLKDSMLVNIRTTIKSQGQQMHNLLCQGTEARHQAPQRTPPVLTITVIICTFW